MTFQPAKRANGKLKMAITGPSKSGKTYTAMRIMNRLCTTGKWAVLDTENGSASKYEGPAPLGFKFDTEIPANHHPDTFVNAIAEAYKAGYEGLIIDSLSHEWMGKGGCLELLDTLTAQSQSKNSYNEWGKVTPLHNKVFETINRAPLHIIATFRVKQEYTMQEYQQGGRTKVRPVKVGLAPVTRDGAEYEFDILMDMDKGTGYIDHTSRCHDLQYVVVQHPGEQLADVIQAWLNGQSSPYQINSGPRIEEKITKVDQAPQPSPPGPDPRPSVPADVAKNAPSTPVASQVQPVPNQSTQSPAPGVAAASGSGLTEIGPNEMAQLLQAGLHNGWTQAQISSFLCSEVFMKASGAQEVLTPQTIAKKMTVKQWEMAVSAVTSYPNGQVPQLAATA